MEIECPKCHTNNEDLEDFLPDRACDSVDYYCNECDHEFSIGWVAEAEIRDSKMGVKGVVKL